MNRATQLASASPPSKASSPAALFKDKQRFAEDIAVNIKTKCLLKHHAEKDIIKLVAKYLDMEDEVTVSPSRCKRLTDLNIREKVWEFFHNVAEESTNTTYIAKLRISNKPLIQTDLPFKSTVRIVTNKRNRQFFQSIWLIVTKTIRELYSDYLHQNPLHRVSIVSFR